MLNNLSDENLIAKEELSKHSIKKYEFKSIADFPLEKPPEKEESDQSNTPTPPPRAPHTLHPARKRSHRVLAQKNR
ncbi:hypothetical protein HBZC1_08760 [Helicobacter bizzozeronii CIII-1]|uniref:Uncharacterized protein n=1 Tax=Helicobacter bizzozeronii (strain CIII-1) TaxID=1002804 RepID=F8KSS8_HELBC|nr:hypothetical protein HBZC1_08760 [Helicobacter bizzozeronii CIII-1]